MILSTGGACVAWGACVAGGRGVHGRWVHDGGHAWQGGIRDMHTLLPPSQADATAMAYGQ